MKARLISRKQTLLQGLLATVEGSLLLFACCNKKGCYSYDRVNIIVKGLAATDTVGVTVYSYVRNSGFDRVVDSFYTRVLPTSYDEQYGFSLPKEISYGNDLRILLSGQARVYEVTDFVLQTSPCNYCLEVIPKDLYTHPVSYVLDGKRVEGRTVIINQ